MYGTGRRGLLVQDRPYAGDLNLKNLSSVTNIHTQLGTTPADLP